MALETKAKTKATKASAIKVKGGDGDGGKVIVTPASIIINLGAKQQKQMKECLKNSGKITFSMKKHSATELPQILENGVLVD